MCKWVIFGLLLGERHLFTTKADNELFFPSSRVFMNKKKNQLQSVQKEGSFQARGVTMSAFTKIEIFL